MPAFSFEKLLPPAPGVAAGSTPRKSTGTSDGKPDGTSGETADKKPRGVIVQVLDRIAGARAGRSRK